MLDLPIRNKLEEDSLQTTLFYKFIIISQAACLGFVKEPSHPET
jgi:hypothetical protein